MDRHQQGLTRTGGSSSGQPVREGHPFPRIEHALAERGGRRGPEGSPHLVTRHGHVLEEGDELILGLGLEEQALGGIVWKSLAEGI